ncbi:MAG: lamin tail domain-containing protein, partial [Nanoarchaeota archaeon]|nr:lamin tail domain-containing protein [Nanoarchaeota archaeon]
INNNSYFLAVRNLANFTNYFLAPENYQELTFSLTNAGKEIVLEGSENCTNTFDYSEYTDFADSNNHTLELREGGTWGESLNQGGTPGYENSIFSFSEDYSKLIITEVLPDPLGDDDGDKPNGEWIEIYNTGDSPLDLDGLFFTDQNYENELYIADNKVISDTGTVINSQEYKVIYRDRDSDFALNNNGYEEVFLYEESGGQKTIIDQITYSGSTEGMSWSLIFGDGNWYLAIPTPGTENSYNLGCDWVLELELENNIFHSEDLTFNLTVRRLDGVADTVTVKGKIENLFGETVKEYSPWTAQHITTSNTEAYSPNLPEGDYQISFWIEDLSCADYNLDNNQINSLVAINPQYKDTESSLSIEKIYLGSDDEAEWGDQFTVKVNIYKGQETKYAIELWAELDDETVSKRSKLNIYEEYQNYTTTLPLQLLANCNQRFSDGKVTLHLEGLGLETTEKFDVYGIDNELCKEYLDYIDELGLNDDSNSLGNQETYQFIDLPLSINPGQVIEITVQILGDDEEHEYLAWPYLYKGNKCYSCYDSAVERNQSIQEFKLAKNELKQISFLIKVDEEMEDGIYKIKTKLIKDQQKTAKEITEDIYVLSGLAENIMEDDQETFSGQLEIDQIGSDSGRLSLFSAKDADKYDGIIVYESSSEKARKLAPYILLVAVFLLLILMFKKKI